MNAVRCSRGNASTWRAGWCRTSWEGDDGQRRYRTEVHAQEVVFLDSSRGGNGGNGNYANTGANPQTDDEDLPF